VQTNEGVSLPTIVVFGFLLAMGELLVFFLFFGMVVSRRGGLESETTCHFGVFHHATMGSFISFFSFSFCCGCKQAKKLPSVPSLCLILL
jgi:hypothetical protein